jgi:hypothetical protein
VLLNKTEQQILQNSVTDGAKQAFHYLRETESTYIPKNFVILKERITSDYFGFGTSVNSFIFKAYGDKLSQLVESGIIEWILRGLKLSITKDEPVALSLNHLIIWFKLWIGLLLVASVVLSAELWIRKFQEALKEKGKRNPS